jgi:uncharacterized protein YndB with AHSA1/START domain
MPPGNSKASVAGDGVLAFTRMFDAPRALVFRMWAAPEHIVRWYGPEGYALQSCELDFRVGGKWRFCMNNGPGHAHWIYGVYREIVEPSRLSFTYVNEYDGIEMLVKMDFIDRGPRTELHFRQEGFQSTGELDGHDWGWKSTLELLNRYVQQFAEGEQPTPKGRPRSEALAAGTLGGR